jgi:hypothetical protein
LLGLDPVYYLRCNVKNIIIYTYMDVILPRTLVSRKLDPYEERVVGLLIKESFVEDQEKLD